MGLARAIFRGFPWVEPGLRDGGEYSLQGRIELGIGRDIPVWGFGDITGVGVGSEEKLGRRPTAASNRPGDQGPSRASGLSILCISPYG